MNKNVKRKKIVTLNKARRKNKKNDPVLYYKNTMAEIRKLKAEANTLYKDVKHEYFQHLKNEFYCKNKHMCVWREKGELIRRIDKIYGVTINDEKVIQKILDNYGYNHIVYELLMLINKKNARNFLNEKSRKNKMIQTKSIKNINRKRKINENSLILLHKLVDLHRNFLFSILTHFEQELCNFVMTSFKNNNVKKDIDNLISYFNKEEINWFWIIIPTFTFGNLLEFMKQNKIIHPKYNYNNIKILKNTRNKVFHGAPFWNLELDQVKIVIKFILNNQNRWNVKLALSNLKKDLTILINKYPNEEIKYIEEYPYFCQINELLKTY